MDREKEATTWVEEYLKLLGPDLKPKEAFEIIKKRGYTQNRRTLNRHIASVRRTGHALSLVKKDCRHYLLNDDQMTQVNTWILRQNTMHIPIRYAEVKKFIQDTFNINVSVRTAANIALRLRVSIKTCQTKTAGFIKLNSELTKDYMGFIRKMKKERRFYRHSSGIRSIDATYTKKPQTDTTTLSPVGSGPQRAASTTNLYTNAIVTMISGDGLDHTPCMLFTHDPRMAKVQPNTPRGNLIRSKFVQALQTYHITEDRIVYVKSPQHYFYESPEVYETFLNHYEIPKNALILHDGGNAFKRQKTSIFENLGYTNHETYPADVHQFLSPNDNSLHGCKSIWYKEYPEFGSDVSASLRLMQLIDLDTEKNSRTYFQRNLFNVTKSDLKEVIGV
jgi:hypothetical protein